MSPTPPATRPPSRNRLYFFWDYDLSEEDVRQILAGDNPHREAWVISRLLNSAFWEDIWSYITLDDIREHWDLLRFRDAFLRDAWAHGLEVWSRAGDQQEIKEPRPTYEAQPAPEPELKPGILTPLQQSFLTGFFAYDVGQQFFLTGGTALAAYYLHHRLSDDLGLFTVDDAALDIAQGMLTPFGQQAGWNVNLRRRSPYFLQAIMTDVGGDLIKVDLVRETGTQFGAKQWCKGAIIDSLVDIAANKVTAILGRAAAKDFVDLYFILRSYGYSIEGLIERAKQKDLGLAEFFFATMLRQIHNITDLPIMLKPVDLETLQAFYDDLADRLLARHGPPG